MSFEFHINGNQTTFFILFVLRSCTFGFADYNCCGNTDFYKRSAPQIWDTLLVIIKVSAVIIILLFILVNPILQKKPDTTSCQATHPV